MLPILFVLLLFFSWWLFDTIVEHCSVPDRTRELQLVLYKATLESTILLLIVSYKLFGNPQPRNGWGWLGEIRSHLPVQVSDPGPLLLGSDALPIGLPGAPKDAFHNNALYSTSLYRLLPDIFGPF